MTSKNQMPANVARLIEVGQARWAGEAVSEEMRARFAPDRIPVSGARHVRVWGVQVDDERELPGHERTQIPDEELWEIQLVARDGSHYQFDSTLLEPAE
ncbi:MAG: hypothetical protein R3200_13715 [Xanthomonadales bacterium]|nr:hypothetical protein [Xanthomonadales bacterium]